MKKEELKSQVGAFRERRGLHARTKEAAIEAAIEITDLWRQKRLAAYRYD